MKKKFALLITFIGIYGCLMAGDGSISIDELLSRIDQNEQSFSSLKINFMQEVKMEYSSGTQSAYGTAYFIKPDKIRIEQKTPQQEIFITDGKKAWFYSPELKQVMISSWDELVKGGKAGSGSLPKGLFDFTNSITQLKESCVIDLKSEDDKFYILNVTPKEIGYGYSINLWISKEDYFPIKTSIITDNAVISTTVTSTEKNPELDKSMFKFKKPKDVTVFDMPF